MQSDRTKTFNQAGTKPETADWLRSQWNEWAERLGIENNITDRKVNYFTEKGVITWKDF